MPLFFHDWVDMHGHCNKQHFGIRCLAGQRRVVSQGQGGEEIYMLPTQALHMLLILMYEE